MDTGFGRKKPVVTFILAYYLTQYILKTLPLRTEGGFRTKVKGSKEPRL
jgi:hypothetical protein